MSEYYDWRESAIQCAECGWSGFGKDAAIGDSFSEGAEYHCPSCDHYFGFRSFPTLDEVRNDPRADTVDKVALAIADAKHKRECDS